MCEHLETMRTTLALLLAASSVACHRPSAPMEAEPPPGSFRFSPRPNRAAEIRWRVWSPTAFERARAEHKPVLLSLAAVWCHWCHVLDETTLSDPRVIALLNRDFIAVRADADQRPDVEQRYILGGWPTVAFLDEDGEILDGGTYVPTENFLAMAEGAKKKYATPRSTPGRTRPPQEFDPTHPGALDPVVEGVTRSLEQAADLSHGGFGRGQKFPSGEAVRLLLEVGETDLARRALDGMLRLEDPVEGGFYRYATRPDWTAPHYEKMLYVEADLIAACAHAARVLGDDKYAAAARRAIAYVRRTLTAPDGSFYASQDADEAYFALDEAARRTRAAPYVDRTLLVDRNARMIDALISASRDLADPTLVETAARAATVLASLRDESGALFHDRRAPTAPDGPAASTPIDAAPATAMKRAAPPAAPRGELAGLLADQAWGALALIEVAKGRGEPASAVAKAVLARAQAALADPRGGFFDEPLPDARAPGRLRHRDKPFEANAAMARALLAAGDRDGARRTLAAFAGSYPLFGTEAALYARAVLAATTAAPP